MAKVTSKNGTIISYDKKGQGPLYGSASTDFMGKTARALSEAMKNAQSRALEGQVHDVKADVLAPVLVEFFRDSSQRVA